MLLTAFAFCITISCSDKSASGPSGLTLNDSIVSALAPPPATSPSAVTDLLASATGSTSVTLSFTQVDDGTGQPAKYNVRYAVSPISWGSATSTTNGTCATPVAGTATGSQLSCTVLGLTPTTNYGFQLVAFRGTMNLNAVYGSLSNTVSATTTASGAPPPAPVASVSVSPASSTLQIGATVQLQVSAFDAGNNVLTGRVVTSSSANPAIASVNSLGLVTAVSVGTTQITVTSEGKSAIATIIVSASAPPPTTNPSTVTDLKASVTGSTSVTLSFTQVNDGTGQPAKYDVRYALAPISWGSATSTTNGTCTTPVAGTATGSQLSCTVLGLTPATNYNFQLIAFRGTMNLGAVYGSLSNAVSATTTASGAPPPAPVASVSVSPASSTLQVGATVQLSAVTRDASNNTLTGRVIAWSSSNPTISTVSASGLVTAKATGSATITALSETKIGTAAITVGAPAPVASVTVSPSSASLRLGATQQLSAVTRDANNNVLTGRVVTWSSSSPALVSVNASGLVTVVAVGSATITATSETKTGTATVTGIVSTGAVWRGNEPASMTAITDQPFTSLPSSGWTPYFSWGLASDATAPHSPNSVFEIVYPAGYAGGNSPGLAEFAVNPNYRQIYICMYVKYSSNWQGHNSLVNKIIHFWVGSINRLVIEGAGSGNGPLTARISLQSIAGGGNQDGGTAGTYESPIQFVRGQWHMVEMVAVANTGSNKDGSVDLYVDGVHAAGVSGVEFQAGGPLFNLVKEDPTWGGQGDVVQSTQSFRVDHIYMSGK
jgi:uncharacterized protein YjdB